MKCSKCGVEPKGKKRSTCNSCHRNQVYERRESRRSEDPELYARDVFNHKLWTQFRMRRDDYDKMMAQQAGSCAICGVTSSGKRGLSIDHDHSCCPSDRSCGKCVRALLCSNCNTSLGGFRDDPALLARAIEYLARHTQNKV